MIEFLKQGERRLFILVICITIGFLFYPTYLPLVDLPQHAAQVVSLDGILKNQYLWGDFTEVNWDTPYLTGYLSWLVIYQVFDIKTSAKVFIVFIFLLYCLSVHCLRRFFNAPCLVEWAAVTSFFGFAYQWGFVTFLLAIPIGIFFFLVNMRWIDKPRVLTWPAVVAVGGLLYVSHILIFAFFCFLTYGYYLITHVLKEQSGEFSLVLPSFKLWFFYTIPYLLFAYLLFRYVSKPDPFTEANANLDIYVFTPLGQKTLELLYMPWNMLESGLYSIIAVLMLMAPILMGYRLSKEIKKYILLFGFIIIWYVMPDNAFHTSMIYQRFAIFFIPFYFLIWERNNQILAYPKLIQKLGLGCLVASIGFWMINVFNNNIQFEKAKETRDFVSLIKGMGSGQRILTLFDTDSRSSGSLSSHMEYIYFGNWYQVEKNGWSDFNFAWFHPQIVRFKISSNPEKLPLGPWVMEPVINGLKKCDDYDAILMKTRIPPPIIKGWINHNLDCKNIDFKENQGEWLLFERQDK